MSNSVFLKANAKLNLFLNIKGKLESNYHDMIMINQSIDIYDEIKVSKNFGNGINIIDDKSGIEKKDNIMYKAAKLIDETKQKINIDIEISKNIPMQAGLGGGSSDCAGIINAIDTLYNLNLSYKEKIEYAVKLGADVPFCMFGGSKYVGGIGEKLSDISSDEFLFLVVKPDENMPTNRAFKLFDESKKEYRDTKFLEKIKNNFKKLDLDFVKKYFYNDFEMVISKEFPIINQIKSDFYENKADFAMMSGSGTTVYCIFENEDIRKKAYDNLKKKYKNIFLAKTVNKSIEILDIK